MPRSRGRTPEAQANLEQSASEPGLADKLAVADASPDKWGALPDDDKARAYALPGAADEGEAPERDGEPALPQQPYLPGQGPTMRDKQMRAIKEREQEIAAIEDKRIKSNARWDGEVAILKRDAKALLEVAEWMEPQIKAEEAAAALRLEEAKSRAAETGAPPAATETVGVTHTATLVGTS